MKETYFQMKHKPSCFTFHPDGTRKKASVEKECTCGASSYNEGYKIGTTHAKRHRYGKLTGIHNTTMSWGAVIEDVVFIGIPFALIVGIIIWIIQ